MLDPDEYGCSLHVDVVVSETTSTNLFVALLSRVDFFIPLQRMKISMAVSILRVGSVEMELDVPRPG